MKRATADSSGSYDRQLIEALEEIKAQRVKTAAKEVQKKFGGKYTIEELAKAINSLKREK